MAQQFKMADDIHPVSSVESDTTASPVLPLDPGVFGPAVADQLAALIVRHWREAIRCGEFDASHPFDVIDLCPGVGHSGTMLCAAISRRIAGMSGLHFRYLPVCPVVQPIDLALREHDSARVEVCPLLWDVEVPASEPRLHGKSDRYRSRNPVVMLAHDAWERFPQQLYAVHYGKLLRARLALIGEDDSKKPKEDLWTSAEPDEWGNELAPILQRYLQEFNSSPIAFSLTGIAVIDSIVSASGGRALVISMGDGHSHELKLRLTSFSEVISAFRKTGRLPVNFQLMAEWMRARGGAVVDVAMSSGEILQLLLISRSSAPERIQAIARCIEPALFAASHHLVEACRSLGASVSLATRLNLLQMSRYDPIVFAAEDRQILAALIKGDDADRDAWRNALEKVWDNHRMYPAENGLHRRIAAVAMHCNHWGFARRVLQYGMQTSEINAEDLANLAWCEVRTGHLKLGKQLISEALAQDASSTLAQEVNRRISERLQARDGAWLVELQHESLPIVLEPLDQGHADAYWRQYRDPQIAVMTGLPALKTVDEVRNWIVSQDKEPGRVNFAVMHSDWGFVGFINLAVSEHAAFFCFWTGVDFQGSGFATAAGRLACAYAATQGVPIMLTSAFKDNHRSIRALDRIGFRKMKIRACPPDQDRIFFSLLDPSTGEIDCDQELVDYYAREKLPMQFEGYVSDALGGSDEQSEAAS
jgi:RimJ/RimL family protein N-acetyltransferase